MHPIYGVSDILEHAFEGHKEISILKARLTAKGLGRAKGQQSKRTSTNPDTLYPQTDMFKWDSLPLFEVVRAKQESSLPLKGPTVVSEDMHPYQYNHSLSPSHTITNTVWRFLSRA